MQTQDWILFFLATSKGASKCRETVLITFATALQGVLRVWLWHRFWDYCWIVDPRNFSVLYLASGSRASAGFAPVSFPSSRLGSAAIFLQPICLHSLSTPPHVTLLHHHFHREQCLFVCWLVGFYTRKFILRLPCWEGQLSADHIFMFFVFLFCHHAASTLITSGTGTGGVW